MPVKIQVNATEETGASKNLKIFDVTVENPDAKKSQMPVKIQVDATEETDASKILMPEKSQMPVKSKSMTLNKQMPVKS